MTNQSNVITTEKNMIDFGKQLSHSFNQNDVVFLLGNLGAGKTTLTRGILYGLGYNGTVPSPTYTLVEPYDINDIQVYHMDLYRLKSADELEMLGVRDFIGQSLCIIEWPDRAESLLPKPDVILNIKSVDDGRAVNIRRC